MTHDNSQAFAARWLPRLHKFQNGLCAYCETLTFLKKTGRNRATFEHKIPKARGGATELGNACMSCARCNNFKGDRTHEEFLHELRAFGGIVGVMKKRQRERLERQRERDRRRAPVREAYLRDKIERPECSPA